MLPDDRRGRLGDWETIGGPGDRVWSTVVDKATRGPEVGSGRGQDDGEATRVPEDGSERRRDVGEATRGPEDGSGRGRGVEEAKRGP